MNKYFLPYQIRYLDDESRIKLYVKSRRIGITYTQSYEDVRDCATGKVPAVWFSSADESAAYEYILYCKKWAQIIDLAAKKFDVEVVEDEKIFSIEFKNGSRITALSSSPKRLRSKGGKIVLDEFAHHPNQMEMWKAAYPAATWGFPIRIISTLNGTKNLFYKFYQDAKARKLNWSLHFTTIYDAVAQGLVDKILKRKTTQKERQQFIDTLRAEAGSEEVFLQEYACIPLDQESFIKRELLLQRVFKTPANPIPPLYIGVDVGRRHNLTVIWIASLQGDRLLPVSVRPLRNTPFDEQLHILNKLLENPTVLHTAIDETGIGMPLAEALQQRFGSWRVSTVYFSNKTKQQLAFHLQMLLETERFFIPDDAEIFDDFLSVTIQTSTAGNFLIASQNTQIHGDFFWAAALCAFAAQQNTIAMPDFTSTGRFTTRWKEYVAF